MTATLRAIKKLPFEQIKLPDLALPIGMKWGGNQPAKAGFEKFYNQHLQSILCLPTHWYTYESEYKNGGIPTKFVISSAEDPVKGGIYRTGVNFTMFDLSKGNRQHSQPIAEMIRDNALKKMQNKMGGTTEWQKLENENLKMCSLRYSAHTPKMIAHRTGDSEGVHYHEVEQVEMAFIQDIVCEKDRGVVFVMTFEAPKVDFVNDPVIEETFRTIKSSGYYAFRPEEEKNDRGEDREEGDDGFVFLQL